MNALHKHNHPNCEPVEQERCHYRQIIDQLISENERLKQQLLLLTDLKNSPPDIHRAETKEYHSPNTEKMVPTAISGNLSQERATQSSRRGVFAKQQ